VLLVSVEELKWCSLNATGLMAGYFLVTAATDLVKASLWRLILTVVKSSVQFKCYSVQNSSSLEPLEVWMYCCTLSLCRV
jgi:hypothetical protein